MKTLNKFINPFLILIFFFYVSATLFDYFKGQNDGLILNFFIHRIALRLIISILIIKLTIKLSLSKNNIISTFFMNVFSGFVFLIIFEILSLFYLKYINNNLSVPSHILIYNNPKYAPPSFENKKHYEDNNDSMGRWRRPFSSLDIIRCSDNKKITYKANSYGARDKERTTKNQNRIAVLGDSFIEGILIDEDKRLTNILEGETNIEFLNCGIIGANPVQYYTIYNSIVKDKLEHNKKIIFVFTGNDFDSDAKIPTIKKLEHPNYRPYWLKKAEKEELKFTLKNHLQSIESQYATENKYNIIKTRDWIYTNLSLYEKLKVEFTSNSYILIALRVIIEKRDKNKMQNIFNKTYELPKEYSPGIDFTLSLNKLIQSNDGKKSLIVLIPAKEQVYEFKKKRINMLAPFIKKNILNDNNNIIDLMPYFANEKDIERFFIKCDGHWSDEGNRFVAKKLLTNPIFVDFIKKNQ